MYKGKSFIGVNLNFNVSVGNTETGGLSADIAEVRYTAAHCPKNIQNLFLKTEPITECTLCDYSTKHTMIIMTAEISCSISYVLNKCIGISVRIYSTYFFIWSNTTVPKLLTVRMRRQNIFCEFFFFSRVYM